MSGPGDEPIDTGIALYFPAPNSFTGEDVLELQTHGSPVIVEMLIERICGLGARLAEPGEFSRRAFLNDKIDLSQAEAIADLIDSASRTAARAAQRSLQGRFSAIIDDLNNQVTDLRVYVEAALDFPEEEVDFLTDRALKTRIDELSARFRSGRGHCPSGLSAPRWRYRGVGRATQCRQIQPAECARRL